MTLLDRLRDIIEELPETSEKLSHGSPTWWGGRKTFATFHDGSYDGGASMNACAKQALNSDGGSEAGAPKPV